MLLVQPQHFRHRGQWYLPLRNATAAPIYQAGVAMFLIAVLPAPQLPTLMPMISAACHQVICLAMARKITSCTFIARSQAASALRFMPHTGMRETQPLQSGHFMC
jgi:hypothetical protein